MSAIPYIQRELRTLQKNPVGGFKVEASDNIYVWTIWFLGPKDSCYENGCYKASLTFPTTFPNSPPKMRILSQFWHPNVYPENGEKSREVCMSILHEAGVDQFNTVESAFDRWTPIQSVHSIVLSFISLLSDPDPSGAGAPANVDALVNFRKSRAGFMKRCKELAEKSLKELPEGFELPSTEDASYDNGNEKSMSGMSESMSGNLYSYNVMTHSCASQEDLGKYSKYRREIAELRDMGLGGGSTDDELYELLVKYNGDMDAVTEQLF
eukprot:Tbor_TRINITY_DN2939_c0_g1::TRINITY_DN2939_c0_g1_i1::g.1162::m.1162/K10575/UBE2G1, UBC7; ubiquitin-conjugating enzyme E2 G1